MSEDFPAYLGGFRPGSLVAGYRLEAQIGVGGMAVVFRARDERLDRLVALKILSPALAADPAFRQRFVAESRAAARVDDPHVLPVYEAAEADGVLFIAMRLVHGGDLQRVLEREGVLSPERAAEFLSPVASALDAAHAAGLVHRDVKPANILVDAREGRPDHVYLSDFGIAKVAASAVSLTQPGMMIGTPVYSAPEQIDGRAVDGRADQYALACLAYRMLTGAAPFERDQSAAVMIAHLYAPPPSLTALRPDLPRAADWVLAKGMAKAPEQRYPSCGDFADALREALGLASYRRAASAAPAASDAPAQHPPTMTGLPPGWPAEPPGSAAGTPDTPTLTSARGMMGDATPPGASASGPAGPGGLLETRQASSPGGSGEPGVTVRRRGPRNAVRVGVPAAVIVAAAAVIVAAVKLHATPGAANAGDVSGPGCGSSFAGYADGGPGRVTVSSIASASGARLAVGSAGGHPAIWRCVPNGAWKLVSGTSVYGLGTQTLTSVAHGPRGWIAVGDGPSGTAGSPVAVTSADGVRWQPVDAAAAFTGPGSCVSSVAVGPAGYVAVGKHVSGNRTYAAMWWSAGMGNWAAGNNDKTGRTDGRLHPSTVYAVASTPAGFVAAGTRGAGGVIWTSADGGRQWTIMPGVQVPAGALRVVTADRNGTVVAAGYANSNGSPSGNGSPNSNSSPSGSSDQVPIVVTSTDGGQHWKPPVTLGPPGTHGSVTALTVAGSGFIAAGTIGSASAQHTVTWQSPDGLTWSKASQAAAGASDVAALSAKGAAVAGTALECAAPYYSRG